MLTKRQAAVDLVLTVAVVLGSAVAAGLVLGLIYSGTPSLPVAVILQGLLALAGAYILLDRRRQTWRSIGLQRPQARDLPRALLVLLTGFAVNAALTAAVVVWSPGVLEAHLSGLESVATDLTLDTPLAASLAVLLLVGFYEEIISRGLLLSRSRRLLGGVWGPVLLSSGLFALGHFYQGAYGVLQTALFGAVLAAFTIRWGTLWPAIIAHAAINMLSVLQLDSVPMPA